MTPLPTYLPSEKEKYLLDLIRSNDGCVFPCWWGITPGGSDWNDFQQIISPIHPFTEPNYKNGLFVYENLLSVNQISIANLEIQITGTESEIQTILVEAGIGGIPSMPEYTDAWGAYKLPFIINEFGTPQRIFLYVQPGQAEAGGSWTYHILLIYDDQNFMVSYVFDGSQGGIGLNPNTDMIVLCPNRAELISIGLYFRSPDHKIPLERIARVDQMIETGFYKDLNSATELDKKEFANRFVGDDTKLCFESIKENW